MKDYLVRVNFLDVDRVIVGNTEVIVKDVIDDENTSVTIAHLAVDQIKQYVNNHVVAFYSFEILRVFD